MVANLWQRIQGKYQRYLAAEVCCRRVRMQNTVPLISFTFDDFPRSALEAGGKILRAHGVAGTYYVSLGLLDRDEVVGRICTFTDLEDALAQGHELGCHTFGHCDPWETKPRLFEESILENRRALERTLPGRRFETIAYPKSTTPRPITKRNTGRHFRCCRAGGQRVNLRTVDLNYVYAFFLERSRDAPDTIWRLIDLNKSQAGWLIFATHDVTENPSRYGCTPGFLDKVVGRAVASGARVLPVGQALAVVCGQPAACAKEPVPTT